jgi:hypothetical protein
MDKLIDSFWQTGGFTLFLAIVGSLMYLHTKKKERKEQERLDNLPPPQFKANVIVRSRKHYDDEITYHIFINGKEADSMFSETKGVNVPKNGFHRKEEAIEASKLIFERHCKEFDGEYDFKEVYAILTNNTEL